MANEPVWLRQHADVLFDTDDDGRLTRPNEPDPESAAPRLFLARGRTTTLLWFRADVPVTVVTECKRLAGDLKAWDGERPDSATYRSLREVLAESEPIVEESKGPAFRFPAGRQRPTDGEAMLIDERSAHLLDRFFPYTRSVLSWRSPVAGVVRDSAVVSACYSARRRPNAAEAGVDTAEAYRGAGLAVQVVDAWARAVEGAGVTPLHSTSWDNVASLRVVAKLGLVAYADTLSLT